MADRCVGCGGWLQPELDVCPTCQRPTKADAAVGSALDGPPELSLGALSAPSPAPSLASAPPIEALEEAPPPPKAPGDAKKGPRPIDDAMVRRLAKYPEKPANPLSSIPYAVSVFQRRQELARERENVATRSRQAGVRADEAFATLGGAVMRARAVLDLEPLASQLAAVETAQGEADERGQEFQQAEAEATAEAEAIDRQLEVAEAELGPFRDRETRLEKELDMAQHELARARARAQRAEIQVRNAGENSGAPPAEGIQSEKQARDAEVLLAEERAAPFAAELASLRRDMASRVASLADLKKSRAALQMGLDSSTGIYRESAGAASEALSSALSDLGRAATDRDLVGELGDPAQLATRAASERDARHRELELHNRALDAYDKKGFQTGGAIIGAAGLFILVALVLMIVR